MGCITISIRRTGGSLTASAGRLGQCPSANIARIGSQLMAYAGKAEGAVNLSATRLGQPLVMTGSLVCDLGSEFYLQVSPGTIWLLPDSVEVVVTANVKWIIE